MKAPKRQENQQGNQFFEENVEEEITFKAQPAYFFPPNFLKVNNHFEF